MTYEEFYKRAKSIWDNQNIDAEETSYWLGELIREIEAAQQSVLAGGAVKPCKCNAYQLENYGCQCGASETPRR